MGLQNFTALLWRCQISLTLTSQSQTSVQVKRI